MKSVFITGASSGIGEALAYIYARQKFIIGLTSRREEMLNNVAKKCSILGGNPFVYQLDVKNRKDCEKIANKFLVDARQINIVIANAGIGGDDGLYKGSSKDINNIINTNILGVTNILMPFIPTMKDQRSGSLVCISSVASFLPLPYHGGYSSSKVAIRMIFDSWRPTLQRYNISTTTICPGFIDTPMVKGAARNFPMKSVDDAAKSFFKAINKKYNTYIYPWTYIPLLWIIKLIPSKFYNYIIKKLFSRPIT